MVSLKGWDAFDYTHTPLPRATGPYAVVRTTNLITSNAKYIQIGAFKRLSADAWSNIVMIEDVNKTASVNASDNTKTRSVPFPGNTMTGSGLTLVPAAISVQVMNPNPLQSTQGILAGCVCHTQLDLNDRVETWDDIATEVISYFRPRLMSAGKLALRGVQVNSYPLNMSALADFRPCVPTADDSTITLNGSAVAPEGLAPIVLINSNGVTLDLLIAVEWRVRFDLGNPAVATHRHHGVTSDWNWNKMLEHAIALGNGVMDIVEHVANSGRTLGPLLERGRMLAA